MLRPAHLRHPTFELAAQERAPADRIAHAPRVVGAEAHIVAGRVVPVGVLVGGHPVLALFDEHMNRQPRIGVDQQDVVVPGIAVRFAGHADHHDQVVRGIAHESLVSCQRAVGAAHHHTDFRRLDVVQVLADARFLGEIGDVLDAKRRDRVEVDDRLPFVAPVGLQRVGLLARQAVDRRDLVVHDGRVGRRLERHRRRDANVLPAAALERRLVGREPENGRDVRGELLEGHRPVRPSPCDAGRLKQLVTAPGSRRRLLRHRGGDGEWPEKQAADDHTGSARPRVRVHRHSFCR